MSALLRSMPVQRDARIDLLRGIAILVVMLLHFSLTYRLTQSPLAVWLTPQFVRALIINGNYGVTIFFAISGFLITSNSLRRAGTLAQIDMRKFYVYRFARIMPTLLLALLAIILFSCLGLPSFADSVHGKPLPASYFVLALVSVLTFWHNVLMQSVGYFNYCLNIYWSLSVEEVFYLALPLAAVLTRRTSMFVALCLALVVAGPVYRAMHADNELFFMYGYVACFDAIALGCLAALLRNRFDLSPLTNRVATIVGVITLTATYFIGIDGHEVFGFSAIALSTSILLVSSPALPRADWSSSRVLQPLNWLGRHSYELYLFHIIVLALMRDLVSRDSLGYAIKLPWLALFIALSAGVAGVISRLFSEPANQALRQYLSTASPMPATQE
ncbi:MAG: acyltransferase [Rudaea sp.]|nr:acyltransferase [Rudaea sp.]